MFGFIVGTLSLLGLYGLLRRGRRWHHRGGHRRWFLRRIFSELDATPGQERVIEEAFENAWSKGYSLRDTLRSVPSAYARAISGEAFNPDAVKEAEAKQDEAVSQARQAIAEGLAKIHEALRPEQRRRAAELLERGLHHRGGCHRSYRSYGGPVHA